MIRTNFYCKIYLLQAYRAGEGGGGGRGEVPGGLHQFQLSHEEAAASGPGPVLLWGEGGEDKMADSRAWVRSFRKRWSHCVKVK